MRTIELDVNVCRSDALMYRKFVDHRCIKQWFVYYEND